MGFDNGLAIKKPFLHDYLPTWFQQYDQELEKKLAIFLSGTFNPKNKPYNYVTSLSFLPHIVMSHISTWLKRKKKFTSYVVCMLNSICYLKKLRFSDLIMWLVDTNMVAISHLTSHQQEQRRGAPSDEIGQILVRFLAAAPDHPPERFDCFLLGGNI